LTFHLDSPFNTIHTYVNEVISLHMLYLVSTVIILTCYLVLTLIWYWGTG